MMTKHRAVSAPCLTRRRGRAGWPCAGAILASLAFAGETSFAAPPPAAPSPREEAPLQRFAEEPTGAPAGGAASDGGSPLASLRREVRRFDFEEATRGHLEFPYDFYRHIASDQGFPAFGSLRLSNTAATSGQSSFQFNLQGGSLAARVPAGVIPVMPMADYVLSADVRTSGLNNSRARLVAWFSDAQGKVIAPSRSESRLARTDGQWETLSVQVMGEFADAADLVIELQLVQPRQYANVGANAGALLLDDVAGTAWFDDVVVWQQPRIELTTASPGNLILPEEPSTLHVVVNDQTSERLTAHLDVFDLMGGRIHAQVFSAARSNRPLEVDLNRPPAGWYRAVLSLRNAQREVARHELDFAVLAGESRRRGGKPVGFGVDVPALTNEQTKQLPVMIRRLGVGSALIALGPDLFRPMGDVNTVTDIAPDLRHAVDELLAETVQLTFVLERVPEQVATLADCAPTQILQLLSGDASRWQPYLERPLISFGQQVRRWQIGATGNDEAFWRRDLAELSAKATAAIASLVPGPQVLLPWSAEQEVGVPAPGARIHGYDITIPYHVQPEAIQECAGAWTAAVSAGNEAVVNLQLPPPDFYSPAERVTDLAVRTLHAWRGGLPQLTIAAPWSGEGTRRSQLMPDPAFCAWRVLAAELDQRRFVSELPLGEGLRCWIMEGQNPGDAALVAWNEYATPESGAQASFRALLGDGPIHVVDLFGNRTLVNMVDGAHTIAVPWMPIFVEHIDLPLVRFAAGFDVKPSFLPAVHRSHELEVVLSNPWDSVITGRLRLDGSDPRGRWQMSPRTHEFSIRPGAEIHLPLSAVFDASAPAGRKRIDATIELAARQNYTLRLRREVEIGLPGIRATPTWSVVRNPDTGQSDLLISLYVTNTGEAPAQLEAFLSAPGVSQRRRPIAGLQPGQTVVRLFQVADGRAQLAGKRIRLGVGDREGDARLNRMMDIPPLPPVAPITQTNAASPAPP